LRFVSAVLAAILCGAAFSACANEVKPPVTEVTTDITTDAPATIAPITTVTTDAYTTDAPVTTEAPETTNAPITETTDISTTSDTTTEGVETTDTPATSPSTTAAPATDAPSVTTEAPDTTSPLDPEATPEEINAEKIKELLYISNDGYVQIKGAERFKLPASGTWLKFKSNKMNAFFATNEDCVIESKPASDSQDPSISIDDGKLYILRDKNGVKELVCDVSSIWEEFSCPIQQLICIDELTYYIIGQPQIRLGTYYTYIVYTKDGGKSFSSYQHTSKYMTPLSVTFHNGKVYLGDITRDSVSDDWIYLTSVSSFSKIHEGMTASPNSASAEAPCFENGIGLWKATLFSQNPDGSRIKLNVFYISADNGETWSLYDPSHLVNIDTVTEIEYRTLK